MQEINLENLKTIVNNIVPELQDIYGEPEGLYILFGNLAIYLGNGIQNNTVNQIVIDEIFNLLNKMSSHKDPNIVNIFAVGFLEVFMDYEEALIATRNKFNSKGMKLLEDLRDFWMGK